MRAPFSRSDFNPRSPHGERLGTQKTRDQRETFQPTLPARGATRRFAFFDAAIQFQPTLPARGATRRLWYGYSATNFNPRSPHGERLCLNDRRIKNVKFQPTLPARGATIIRSGLRDAIDISTHAPRTGSDANTGAVADSVTNFNPRSPHGERQYFSSCDFWHILISTHAPRTGSDV